MTVPEVVDPDVMQTGTGSDVKIHFGQTGVSERTHAAANIEIITKSLVLLSSFIMFCKDLDQGLRKLHRSIAALVLGRRDPILSMQLLIQAL